MQASFALPCSSSLRYVNGRPFFLRDRDVNFYCFAGDGLKIVKEILVFAGGMNEMIDRMAIGEWFR